MFMLNKLFESESIAFLTLQHLLYEVRAVCVACSV